MLTERILSDSCISVLLTSFSNSDIKKILEICKIIGLLTAKDWHWLVCPDDELVTVAVSRIGRSDFKLQKIQTQLANGKIAFVINLKASAVPQCEIKAEQK